MPHTSDISLQGYCYSIGFFLEQIQHFHFKVYFIGPIFGTLRAQTGLNF